MQKAATQHGVSIARSNAADDAIMKIVSKVRTAHKTACASRTSDEDREAALITARTLTLRAMAIKGASQVGARGKVELMILHYERGGEPEHPKIELNPLREILSLLPVAA